MKLRPNGMHLGHPCFLPDDYMKRVRRNLTEMERSASSSQLTAGDPDLVDPLPDDEPEPEPTDS